MSKFVAALPMYDFPELRAEVDAQWVEVRDRLRAAGIDAPEALARRNADLPAVPGGIRDAAGSVIAPDPATLPPDEFDLFTLWRHPRLLFSQTCWGPMVSGLEAHVEVVAQPGDYSLYEGGESEFYSSAIVARGSGPSLPAPQGRDAIIPVDRLRGARFVFNNHDSMSGLLGITRDLAEIGESPELFSSRTETGSHRLSAKAIAEGRADLAAIDCRTLSLIRRFDAETAQALQIIGWTARRKGLPFIRARGLPAEIRQYYPHLN